MRYFISQLRQDDCGFAAFKMVLASLSHSRKALYLMNPKKEGNYTFFELQQYASSFGLTLKGYQTENLSSFSCPFIALMRTEEQRFHYLVVDQITSNHVFYRDPAFGRKKEKKKEFFSFFSGYLLAVQYYEKKKIKSSISLFSFHYLFLVIYVMISFLLFFFLPSEYAFLFSFITFFLYEQMGKGWLEHEFIKQIPSYFKKTHHTKENYQEYVDQLRKCKEYPFALVQMIGGLYLLFLYGRYTGIGLWHFLVATFIGLFLTLMDQHGKEKEFQLEKMENSLLQSAKEEKDIACYQKQIEHYLQKKKLLHFLSYFSLFFLCFIENAWEGKILLSSFIAQFIFHILFVKTSYQILTLVSQHEKRIASYLYIKSFYGGEKEK